MYSSLGLDLRSAGFKFKNKYVVDTEAGIGMGTRNNEDQGTRTP